MQNFFDTARLSEHLIGDTSIYMYIQDLGSCIESLIELYKITEDSKYQTEGRSLSNYLINDYWDSEYKNLFNGDGGFLMTPSRDKSNYKKITDNSYAIYLFSQQSNTTFTISSEA